jgi:hypothetical protein
VGSSKKGRLKKFQAMTAAIDQFTRFLKDRAEEIMLWKILGDFFAFITLLINNLKYV